MTYLQLLASLLMTLTMAGQGVLPLENAINIALEQNYGIRIAEMENDAVRMQIYPANAGMGPVIDWNVNYSMTGNNVNQKFISGEGVNRFGRSFNPNTNVTLGLNLYDGGRRKATFDRLGLLSELSELEGKVVIQNTIVDVMQTYYDIVRQKRTVDFLETVIQYYDERLKITEERWMVGRGSKLDFLQSKTDSNVQLAELARAENNLKNGKVLLNGLLNRELDTDFEPERLVYSTPSFTLGDLINQASVNNRDLMLLQKSWDISRKQEQEVEATRAPQVDLNGLVGYAYSNSNAGFLLSNQSLSATAGVSARWNIYDGKDRKNQLAIAKINSRIIEERQADLEFQIRTDLTFAYNQYLSDIELLGLEEQNKTIAEENLSISIEKFRLGGSTILELIEAQRAFDLALNRLVNAQYNVKISELDLLRLSGSLVE